VSLYGKFCLEVLTTARGLGILWNMNNAQQPTATAPQPCDICHEPIDAGQSFHDDGDEIAHTHCVSSWFRGNFGREALR
jgi:hypothetical protein